jgi:hypothetical protein
MSAPHGAELSEMRVMALHALALEREISEEDLDAAMDSGEPKAALIRLLVAAQPTASAALVARLRGGAAEREAAYAELYRREAEHHAASSDGTGPAELADITELAELAAAVASPLSEVLCKPAAEVSADEYQRAALLLAALSGVDPARVGGECCKPDPQCGIFNAWAAPGSALGVVLAKQPASLMTSDDALLIASAMAPIAVQWSSSKGADGAAESAGITTAGWVEPIMSSQFLLAMPGKQEKNDRSLALTPMLLEMLKAPDQLPEFALSGVLCALSWAVIGRPVVAECLLELGAIEVLVEFLAQATPSELLATVGFSRRSHGYALSVLKEMTEAARVDVTVQMLSSGCIDVVVSALSATEQLGEGNVNGYVVCLGALWLLMSVDGEALEQIQDKAREIKSALRWLSDSSVKDAIDLGCTASLFGATLAAQLFGKDEDSSFALSERDIDGHMWWNIEFMRCESFGAAYALPPSRCRGLLSCCISDETKRLLLAHAGFIPHLVRIPQPVSRCVSRRRSHVL